ncbi:MAG TPA: hypothetical protein ENK05_14365 [Gammaproteobacteria bacterium]|nr:hypothetical protein [Gammaproteobacteria bacterium]
MTDRKKEVRKEIEKIKRFNKHLVAGIEKLDSDEKPFCNFCGKTEEEVETLLAGADAYICNECVLITYKIITENIEQ